MFKKTICLFFTLLSLLFLLTGCDIGLFGVYYFPDQINRPNIPAVSEEISSVSTTPEVKNSTFEIVGYLPRYQISNVDVSIASNLTDLIYFTFWPKSDGGFTSDAMTPSHLKFLQEVKRRYKVKILIGIANHSKEGALSTICHSPELRTTFSQGLANYLLTMNFDGADIDWEYPSEKDNAAFGSLLKEMKKTFSPLGLKLTVAVSPSKPLTAEAYAAADRIHAMLYDDWGRHSTLENSAYHIQNFISQGVSPSKLQLGVPFYGRGYSESGPGWEKTLSYKSLQERFSPPPNADTISGYYFNGVETVKQKVRLAKAEGLSGVMVWELGQDTKDDTSLLKAITDTKNSFN